MTLEELNRIGSDLAALPPRPWRTDGETYDEDCEPHPIAWALEDAMGLSIWSSGGGEYAHPSLATGTFIARAPETIAALVAEVRKLRTLRAEARTAVGDEVCIDCGIGGQSVWCDIDDALAEGRRAVVKIEPTEPPRPFWPEGVSCPKCLVLLAKDGACERCNTLFRERR